MMKTHEDPNYDWGYQQQTGESTDSSFDDHVDNDRDGMDGERILRNIAHLLTQLSTDGPGAPVGKSRDSLETSGATKLDSTRSRRRKREYISSTRTSAGNQRKSITTPEREVPSLPEQSSNRDALQQLIIGLTTPDDPAPNLVEISPNEDFDLDDSYLGQYGGNETEESILEKERQFRSRCWANQKLAAALYSHPQSLRSFCVEVYRAATVRSLKINAKEKDPYAEDPDVILLHNNYYGESIPYPSTRYSTLLY